jgi:serine/threonine protein kinase
LSAGASPPIESLLPVAPAERRMALLLDLLGVEVDYRIGQQEQPMHGDYADRFPELSAALFQAILEGRLGGADSLVGRKVHVYQCVSLIGAGAMGRVYLAQHQDLHRHCALKILAPRCGTFDSDYIARFQIEGRAAAALIHPNIVTLHAIGQVDGTHFLEMEFIPGKSLRQLIRSEGPLPADRALRLLTMVADGLAAAHRAGIVHRDVKPDNILVTRTGVAKIGDFGLARQLLSADDDHWDKVVCGTPHYMAPELFRAEPATPASDVYALGLCLYELLAGRLPWSKISLTTLATHGRAESIPDIRIVRPDVSSEIATAIRLLTADDPTRRPADAVAATRLLHAVLGQERDVESLLLEAFGGDRSVTWVRDGERYLVTRHLPDKRRQLVYLEPWIDPSEERLLLLYSLCCPAQSDYFEHALRANSVAWHGSLAIRDVGGEAMFVVINAYPRSTVAPEEIRRSILQIAMEADRVERELTGRDRN